MASFAATIFAPIRTQGPTHFSDPSFSPVNSTTVSASTGHRSTDRKRNNRRDLKAKSTAAGVGGGGGSASAAKYMGTQMRVEKLAELIEKKVTEAKEVCEGDKESDECKVAWDEVEEVSQAKADLRLKLAREEDPLESFCHDNPETDECRIYED